jgi:hypothetical protein
MRRRTTVTSAILSAIVLSAFLLWRTGNAPEWVYRGHLADEVRRRTGIDLADTAAADAPFRIENVRATRRDPPVLEFDVVNRGRDSIPFFQAWAVFRLPSRDRLRSPIVFVADRGRVLRPGERRAVRLEAERPAIGGALAARAVLTADLYCSTSWRLEPYRVKPCRELIPVRAPAEPREAPRTGRP